MKKNLKLAVLLCLILTVLASAFAFGASAMPVDNSVYQGAYAYVAPQIDGEMDAVWEDSPELKFGKAENGYIKVLWRDTTLYFLAVVENNCTQVDFVVASRFYNAKDEGTWGWGGNYGLTVKADTDSDAEDYVASTAADFLKAASQIASGATVKTKATEKGFVAEVALPITVTANQGGFPKNPQDSKVGFFGIGAFVNGDYTIQGNVVGFDSALVSQKAYYLAAVCMKPCQHMHTAPANCQSGETCTGCGKAIGTTPDPTNHAEEAIWVKTDEEGHHKFYPCCETAEETNEPHEWDTERTVDKPATCTEKGEDSIHCKKCDARKDVGVLNALGHDFAEEYTTTKEPDCENDGSETRKCTRCDEGMDTRAIPKLGHDFAADYTVDEEPDCTNKGSQSKHCSRCDAKDDVQEIPALEHDFPEEFVVDVKPTCTKSGSESRHCTRCDETTDTREVPAAGHKWSDWTTVAAATCKKPGARHKTCTVCWVEGEVETVTVPHTAGEWIIDKEAAPGVAGKRHHVCTVCKAVFDEEEIPALPVADTDNKTTDTDSHPYAVIGCKGSLTATAGTVGVLLLPLALVVCGKRRKERESE